MRSLSKVELFNTHGGAEIAIDKEAVASKSFLYGSLTYMITNSALMSSYKDSIKGVKGGEYLTSGFAPLAAAAVIGLGHYWYNTIDINWGSVADNLHDTVDSWDDQDQK